MKIHLLAGALSDPETRARDGSRLRGRAALLVRHRGRLTSLRNDPAQRAADPARPGNNGARSLELEFEHLHRVTEVDCASHRPSFSLSPSSALIVSRMKSGPPADRTGSRCRTRLFWFHKNLFHTGSADRAPFTAVSP